MVDRSVEGEQLDSFLSSLSTLHHSYLSPSSPTCVPLVPDPTPTLEAILSPSLTPVQQWAWLRETGLVQHLYLQVYQILEETYYPQYCQSEQVGPISMHSYTYTPIPHTVIHRIWYVHYSSIPSTSYSRPMASRLPVWNGHTHRA